MRVVKIEPLSVELNLKQFLLPGLNDLRTIGLKSHRDSN